MTTRQIKTLIETATSRREAETLVNRMREAVLHDWADMADLIAARAALAALN